MLVRLFCRVSNRILSGVLSLSFDNDLLIRETELMSEAICKLSLNIGPRLWKDISRYFAARHLWARLFVRGVGNDVGVSLNKGWYSPVRVCRLCEFTCNPTDYLHFVILELGCKFRKASMSKSFVYILIVILVVGCDRRYNHNDPEIYSHKENIKYSFPLVGKVVLKYTDSVFVGRFGSFAVFKDGRLSIGDHLDSKVKIFSGDGKYIKSISRKGRGPGETEELRSHSIDDSGRVWISDRRLRRVSMYDASGTVQDTWSPLDNCNDCNFSSGIIRVVNNKVYVGVIRGVAYPIKVSSISSLISAFDFQHKRIAEYGKYEQIVEEYSVDYPYGVFAVDPSGNLYFLHELSYNIWKCSPDGRILKRFNYPVKDFRPVREKRPQRSGQRPVAEWFTTMTTPGNMEIVGTHLFVSFADRDPQWADYYELRYRHEYLQVFDLDGNCLVDYLKAPGQLIGSDDAGILYFLEEEEPERIVISKYKFVVEGE